MINNITLGKFFPKNSLIHKLDLRVKIAMMIILLACVFLSKSYFSLGFNFLAIIIFIFLSKISINIYLKNIKSILFIILITNIFNIFYEKGRIIFKIFSLSITDKGLYNCIFVSSRLILLILISSLLTFTTSPTDLTDSLDRILKPLNKIKIKTHELAMMMTITLRFIPTLLDETNIIIDAQKTRGADFESGNLLKRGKSLIPVMIPLFFMSFKKAYDLAIAMETRCYRGGEFRTRMKILHIGTKDIVSLLIVSLILIFTIIFNCIFK